LRNCCKKNQQVPAISPFLFLINIEEIQDKIEDVQKSWQDEDEDAKGHPSIISKPFQECENSSKVPPRKFDEKFVP